MKTIIFLLIIIGFTYSCTDSDDTRTSNKLVGEWKLTAMKVSPGGEANFEDVTSNRTLTFNANNTFTCNGEFCLSTLDATTSTDGTYSLTNFQLNSDACTLEWDYTFTIDADTLVIDYPGIETVQAKYVKQ